MAITDKLTAIAEAIRAKDGSTIPMTLDQMPEKIAAITTGGGSSAIALGDVNFYDYDGTLLYSYTIEEAQILTALPDLPTQDGLICQGWNYTLDQIKAENAAVNVGAMYITDDSKTRIYIHLEDGRLSPMLGLGVNGTVTVDWGDGNTSTLTGTSVSRDVYTDNHTYTSAGDYVIKLEVDGSAAFLGNTSAGSYLLRYTNTTDNRNNAYYNAIQKVEIGSNVISILNSAFYNCYSLSSIAIPSGVTSIESNAFYNCYSLSSIAIPSGVTNIGNNIFYNCYSLSSIAIPSGVTSIESNAFYNCYSLSSIAIPSGVTSIESNAFYNCYSLSSIAIPSGVTSIGSSAFSNCYSLSSIAIPSGVTSIGSYAFYNCYSLSSIAIPSGVTSILNSTFGSCYSLSSIAIPSGVTSIGNNSFYNCYSLSSITIPSGVTNIGNNSFYNCYSLSSIAIPSGVTSILNSAFYNCYSLSSIAIPSGVTSIKSNAFYKCYSVAYYDFSSHTSVPTLSSTNPFTGIAADCEIRVPVSLADEWKAATNWSTYADYIVGV